MRNTLVSLLFLASTPAPAQAGAALDLARCAGIADAVFLQDYRTTDDPKIIGDIADEAHVFYVLARREGTALSAVLHLERLRARDAFLRLTDDDELHTRAQACSDLRQALMREGRWSEDPAR